MRESGRSREIRCREEDAGGVGEEQEKSDESGAGGAGEDFQEMTRDGPCLGGRRTCPGKYSLTVHWSTAAIRPCLIARSATACTPAGSGRHGWSKSTARRT